MLDQTYCAFGGSPYDRITRESLSECHPISKAHMRMVIEILERGGGNLLFLSQNLQDSSDCAKNRAPDSSWIVFDDRI